LCLCGVCVALCAAAAESKSYIGCEYYAVDLDNAIEVLDNLLPGLLQCNDLYPGSHEDSTTPVCYDASAQDSQGLCDENNACPTGYTCQPAPPDAPVCV